MGILEKIQVGTLKGTQTNWPLNCRLLSDKISTVWLFKLTWDIVYYNDR